MHGATARRRRRQEPRWSLFARARCHLHRTFRSVDLSALRRLRRRTRAGRRARVAHTGRMKLDQNVLLSFKCGRVFKHQVRRAWALSRNSRCRAAGRAGVRPPLGQHATVRPIMLISSYRPGTGRGPRRPCRRCRHVPPPPPCSGRVLRPTHHQDPSLLQGEDPTARINSISFHRTSDLLVSASDDDSIRLYNTQTGLEDRWV